jgi:NADPH-dependent curcumin reductase CurA
MGRENLEIRIARVPDGALTPAHFEAVTAAVAEPAEGEVLVRTLAITI